MARHELTFCLISVQALRHSVELCTEAEGRQGDPHLQRLLLHRQSHCPALPQHHDQVTVLVIAMSHGVCGAHRRSRLESGTLNLTGSAQSFLSALYRHFHLL